MMQVYRCLRRRDGRTKTVIRQVIGCVERAIDRRPRHAASCLVTFVQAEFTGGEVTFFRAQFTGGEITFDGAFGLGALPEQTGLSTGGGQRLGWVVPLAVSLAARRAHVVFSRPVLGLDCCSRRGG